MELWNVVGVMGILFTHRVCPFHYSNTPDFIREDSLFPNSQQLNQGLFPHQYLNDTFLENTKNSVSPKRHALLGRKIQVKHFLRF
jgi:hypothetical protein